MDARDADQDLSASAEVRVRVDDGLHGAVDRRDPPLDLRETLHEEAAQKQRSGLAVLSRV
ncbi:hypothetical protein [Jannaschia formosa]|uniref:hypothetical protein n=1 Tax=Jannaschia formosa TaxID=2259592 RepID=UPI001FD76838|nr:hypothetical protein [Jannaschia formosa]